MIDNKNEVIIKVPEALYHIFGDTLRNAHYDYSRDIPTIRLNTITNGVYYIFQPDSVECDKCHGSGRINT